MGTFADPKFCYKMIFCTTGFLLILNILFKLNKNLIFIMFVNSEWCAYKCDHSEYKLCQDKHLPVSLQCRHRPMHIPYLVYKHTWMCHELIKLVCLWAWEFLFIFYLIFRTKEFNKIIIIQLISSHYFGHQNKSELMLNLNDINNFHSLTLI